jgi:hypothetical protein
MLVPQVSPISPLLANLYMRRFVLEWKKLNLDKSLGTRIVTYADGLVILCRRGNAYIGMRPSKKSIGTGLITNRPNDRDKIVKPSVPQVVTSE